MRNFQFHFNFSHYVTCLALFLEQRVQLCLPFIAANQLPPKHILESSFLMEIYRSKDTEADTDTRYGLGEWSARRRVLFLTSHNTHNRHTCLRWDSNPPSQQASGRRPILYTARPLEPADKSVKSKKLISWLTVWRLTTYIWVVPHR